MPNFNPLSSTVTFDDLLKANKQAFDQIFSAQTKELGLLGASRRPPTTADLASASLASEAAGLSTDLYAMLNERYGSRWSSEVVEHKTERGSVTVLCKLTVDSTSKMQFGSAGTGSATHLGCLLMNYLLKVNVTHVPYRGSGPAMQDLQGGRIDYLCDVMTTAKPPIDRAAAATALSASGRILTREPCDAEV